MAGTTADRTSVPGHLATHDQSAQRFYASQVFSDLIITCKDHEWKVHKFQVCGHSDFFYKACSGQFKEAKEGIVPLDDDDDEPQVVDAMLYYMYHGTYMDPGNAPTDIHPMLLDAKLFIIADKYLIKSLKEAASKKFAEHSSECWNLVEFAYVVRKIYETGVEDMAFKAAILNTVKMHAKHLFGRKDEYPEIHKVMRETPAFAADVLMELAASTKTFSTGIAGLSQE